MGAMPTFRLIMPVGRRQGSLPHPEKDFERPVAKRSLNWAILCDTDEGQQVFLVSETKGDLKNLREAERAQNHAAKHISQRSTCRSSRTPALVVCSRMHDLAP
ncbi:MAG: hypothetical protein V4696_06390 [Pseudomonadota bacterium]